MATTNVSCSFGFNDGISQPTVEGFPPDAKKVFHGSVGTRGKEWNTYPQSTFVIQDADGVSRPKWTKHGSFLVFRKLEQDVKRWNDDIEADAARRGMNPTLLAAKMVGRWPSGKWSLFFTRWVTSVLTVESRLPSHAQHN